MDRDGDVGINPLGRGDEEVAARLYAAIIATESEALDGPHVVVCRSRSTGVLTFSGPYPSALDALTAVDGDERAERRAGNRDLAFHVARLFPPLT